jgi:hypothetical protein
MLCRNSGSYSTASHHVDPGSSPGQFVWDLWWTMQQWGRFSPNTWFHLLCIPVIAPHPSSFIIRGWYNRPSSERHTKWTQADSNPANRKELLIVEEHCLLGCFHIGINYRCLWDFVPCRSSSIRRFGTKFQKASIIDTTVKSSQKTMFLEY